MPTSALCKPKHYASAGRVARCFTHLFHLSRFVHHVCRPSSSSHNHTHLIPLHLTQTHSNKHALGQAKTNKQAKSTHHTTTQQASTFTRAASKAMSMSITPTEKTQEILSQAKDLAMEMKNTQVRRGWVGGWEGGDGGTEGGRCGCVGGRKVDLRDARGTYGALRVSSRGGPEAVR